MLPCAKLSIIVLPWFSVRKNSNNYVLRYLLIFRASGRRTLQTSFIRGTQPRRFPGSPGPPRVRWGPQSRSPRTGRMRRGKSSRSTRYVSHMIFKYFSNDLTIFFLGSSTFWRLRWFPSTGVCRTSGYLREFVFRSPFFGKFKILYCKKVCWDVAGEFACCKKGRRAKQVFLCS